MEGIQAQHVCKSTCRSGGEKVKTEKQLKSLGGVFAFFKDREIEFLPLAKKLLNVSVFWVVFFNDLTKKKKKKRKISLNVFKPQGDETSSD